MTITEEAIINDSDLTDEVVELLRKLLNLEPDKPITQLTIMLKRPILSDDATQIELHDTYSKCKYDISIKTVKNDG